MNQAGITPEGPRETLQQVLALLACQVAFLSFRISAVRHEHPHSSGHKNNWRSFLQPDVPITLEVLHLVFSAFGQVHKIATFEKQAGLQALVQFDDTPTAEAVRLSFSSPVWLPVNNSGKELLES